MDTTLSVQEAAAYYDVSPATIRRRIKAGELRAFRQRTPQGYEWRIYPPDQQYDDQLPATDDQLRVIDDQPPSRATLPVSPTADDQPPHSDDQLIAMLERMHQENVQLAGQVGFLQARVQSLEDQVRMLTVDKEPEKSGVEISTPEPAPPSEPRSPLWRWVRRRLKRT